MRKLAVMVAWASLVSLFASCSGQPSESEPPQGLNADDEATRLAAIDALGQQPEKTDQAVAELIAQLGDESAMVRAHAADALGKIGPPAKPAAESLAKLVFDKDAAVRREAITAYRSIRPGPEVSIPLFTKLFEKADPETRVHVMNAMAEEGKQIVPALIEGLRRQESAYWACLVLAEIGRRRTLGKQH